jgi:hypothetical protein
MMSRLPLLLLLVSLKLAAAAGLQGCGRTYSQATPEDVLESARAMVEGGDAHRLPDLIYAESAEMRNLLTQFGRVLTSLQALAVELNRAFPAEIAEIRAQAEEAARRGDTTGLIGRMVGGQRSGMQNRSRQRDQRQALGGSGTSGMQQSFNQAMQELVADPYGWLERSEGRLSTQIVTDDMAAILWDDKPAFGIGMLMKNEGGKWYILPPTLFPGANRFVPKTPEMWQIASSLVAALDNAIKDTQREVRSGKHSSLEDLARSVGNKAAIPAAAIVIAYERTRLLEEREERERRRQAAEAARSDAPAGTGN